MEDIEDPVGIEQLFGEAIFTYTRRQAIEDGEQIDLSESSTAKQAFRFPVFITRSVWEMCVVVPPNKPTQDEDGRLWDVLWMARNAIARLPVTTDTVPFTVSVVTAAGRRIKHLIAQCGALDIDNAAPSITIMDPSEV